LQLCKHKIDTQADVEVKLDKPIEIKAGEALGLMGEYNQTGESGEELLHLEVFTYDDIEQFKVKAEAAYKQDKEKKGIKDNFLYVARGSQLYTVLKDEVVELEKTQVEIMVPLADVAKQTVKKKTDKTGKDYYNVQPYLYSLVQKNKEDGIYVDDSHLTHGLLFPGVNVFNQTENGLCIFKHGLHQHIDPKSDLTIEQKNELDPMFKSIMDELDLDKDKNAAVSFEAGKLKDLLLSPVQQRRLTGIVAKHDSEWKKTRAADLGSREAQYTVAEMLADIEDEEETKEAFKYRLNLVKQLWACASEQGLGEASINLGISLQSDKKYSEAVKVFYQGVKNGDAMSASTLRGGFSQQTTKDNRLDFLDLAPDEERSRRYDIIWNYLAKYDYLQPKVPDLDEIVPLPPAKLPKWDGKIAFQRWYEGEAPPKPDEALVRRLAWRAGLNGETGLDEKTGMPKKLTK